MKSQWFLKHTYVHFRGNMVYAKESYPDWEIAA